jgi:hypothetical protein
LVSGKVSLDYPRSSRIDFEAEYTPISLKTAAATYYIDSDHIESNPMLTGKAKWQVENRILELLKYPICGLTRCV